MEENKYRYFNALVDANYFVAKMFLDDLGYDFMGLRSVAVDYMQLDLDRRLQAQQEVGI